MSTSIVKISTSLTWSYMKEIMQASRAGPLACEMSNNTDAALFFISEDKQTGRAKMQDSRPLFALYVS